MSLDLKIKGGTVLDGSGFPRFKADVGVRDGKIVALGALADAAKDEIDADGLMVAPGFIDVHTHYDAQVSFEPLLSASCWHGVTTAVIGNCGLSLAPVSDGGRDYLIDIWSKVEQLSKSSLAQGPSWQWKSFGDYLDAIDKGLGMNVLSMAGYNALRLEVMGPDAAERPARPDEFAKLQASCRKAVAEGAFGWSTSMARTHIDPRGNPIASVRASYDEMLAMSDAMTGSSVGAIGIIPKSLVDGCLSEEDKSLLEGMARRSGRPVIWNGHAFRWDKPEKWRDDQAFMKAAAKRGALVYASSRLHTQARRVNLKRTAFFDHLPMWPEVLAKPLEERVRALADPVVRTGLRHGIDNPNTGDSATGMQRPVTRWDGLKVDKVALAKNKHLEGRNVVELARSTNRHVADVICDLAVEENLESQFFYCPTLESDDDARGELIAQPNTMPGSSDSGAHVNTYCMAGEPTYFLRYWVLQRGLMSLEEGVRAWTFKPAMAFGLNDRGLIRPGMAADIIVFDERTIDEGPQEMVQDFPAGETRFISRGKGIAASVVNGTVVTRDGKHTGRLPGRVLRSTDYQ
jgi:N-acyl-D-amino-acid deacylase